MEMNKTKQKKGFLLRDFVVVGIIFGVTVALYIMAVASIADNYNNVDIISQNFANHYSKLTTNLNQLDHSYQAVQGSEGLNIIGAFDIAFNSVFTVIVMVWDGILIYTGMAHNLATDFSFLDSDVILLFFGAIIAILTTYLIFVWLSSVSRGKI